MNAVRLRCAACCAALVIWSGLAAGVRAESAAPQLTELLKKLPADSAAIRAELLRLTADDIRALCEMLVEPGTADDNAARYALHGLALAAADPGQDAARATFARAVSQVLATQAHDRAFLIEQLHLLGDAQVVAELGKQLGEEASCDAAARTLVTLGGPAAADALRAALPQAQGRSRLSVIEALGALGDAKCVPALLKDAASTETPLRLAALYALARSGDPQAEPLLDKATQAESWYERSCATDDLLVYAARRAELKKPEDAARICRALYQTRSAPADTHVRCAAVSVLAQALGATAMSDILAALADANPQVQAAAANVAVALPGKEATTAFVAQLDKAPPPVRTTLIGVLGRRGDEAALPNVTKALGDGQAEVRLAAIVAVATLGREKAVAPLVKAADTNNGADSAAVREALAHIPGDAATAQLKDALKAAPPAVRVVVLDALAARPPSGTLEPVFAATQDADVAVRTAALRALGVLGRDADVPALLKLLIAAKSDDEREAGTQATASCARRAPDRQQSAGLVVAALDGQNESTRAALLRVLGRVGGPRALEAVLAGTADASAEIREAAVRAFTDWPDESAAPQILALAEKLDDTKLQVLAVRAYVRQIELNTDRPAAKTLEMCAAAMKAARRPDEKKLVLARLGEVREPESLRMLQPYVADEALRTEAASALLDIADELIPRNLKDLRSAAEAVLAASPAQSIRERAEKLRERTEEYDGLIEDWWVSGPYREHNKVGAELFDVVFPPEKPDAKDVEWRKQPHNRDLWRQWAVDLHATMRGDHAAAYLFTRVYSPQAQPARLEIGSDDSVKAWLNGALVHANNASRGVEINQDRAEIALQQGWNTLMLKIASGAGAWEACARVRSPEGQALDGVRVEAGEKP